jgi:HD-like signal output (HDOD) protein
MEDRMATAEDRLTSWVRQTLGEEPGALPAFPAIAARLVALLEHPDAELAEIESLIHQDQAIAAEVVRTANSPLYAGAMRIDSLSAAVLRLGFRETANVALTAACRSLYDIEERAELETFPELWRSLWLDSLVCAFGARLLSRELKLGDEERVFLGALFRDVCSLLILKTLARGLVRGRLREPPSGAALDTSLSALHSEIGAAYLRDAQLPDYVIEAARDHHALSPALEPRTLELHLIRLAGGLSEQLGVAPFSCSEMGPAGAQSLAALEIPADRCEYFASQFEGILEQVRELL